MQQFFIQEASVHESLAETLISMISETQELEKLRLYCKTVQELKFAKRNISTESLRELNEGVSTLLDEVLDATCKRSLKKCKMTILEALEEQGDEEALGELANLRLEPATPGVGSKTPSSVAGRRSATAEPRFNFDLDRTLTGAIAGLEEEDPEIEEDDVDMVPERPSWVQRRLPEKYPSTSTPTSGNPPLKAPVVFLTPSSPSALRKSTRKKPD